MKRLAILTVACAAFMLPAAALETHDPATIAACTVIAPEEASAVMGVPFLEYEALYKDQSDSTVAISICHLKFKSAAGDVWDIGFDFASYAEQSGAEKAFVRDTTKPDDPNSIVKKEKQALSDLGDEAIQIVQKYKSSGAWGYTLIKWRKGSVVYDLTIGDGDQNSTLSAEQLRKLAEFITTKPLPPVKAP